MADWRKRKSRQCKDPADPNKQVPASRLSAPLVHGGYSRITQALRAAAANITHEDGCTVPMAVSDERRQLSAGIYPVTGSTHCPHYTSVIER